MQEKSYTIKIYFERKAKVLHFAHRPQCRASVGRFPRRAIVAGTGRESITGTGDSEPGSISELLTRRINAAIVRERVVWGTYGGVFSRAFRG